MTVRRRLIATRHTCLSMSLFVHGITKADNCLKGDYELADTAEVEWTYASWAEECLEDNGCHFIAICRHIAQQFRKLERVRTSGTIFLQAGWMPFQSPKQTQNNQGSTPSVIILHTTAKRPSPSDATNYIPIHRG